MKISCIAILNYPSLHNFSLSLSMLSIGIPIYNQDVQTLVYTLLRQCQEAAIDYEVICMDDGSSDRFKQTNRTLQELKNVVYLESATNEGRATTRNKIAAQARYTYLLYLDSDVCICSSDFIGRYVATIQKNYPVVVGGIAYDPAQENATNRLHYRYGSLREAKPAVIRSSHPYSSFLTGNLLIRTALIIDLPFLAALKEYGHEDTLLCLELKGKGIPIKHIDNPVVHEGLESNPVFISKQLTAVDNLAWLMQKGYDMSSLKIGATYLWLKKWHLHTLFAGLFGAIQSTIYTLLKSGRTTSLILFDMLRLYELHRCMQCDRK
jgi:glycosyltransferase involved in cell wall biosynthesis